MSDSTPLLRGNSRRRIEVEDVLSTLAEAEHALPVDEWLIDGLRVWPIVRNYWAHGMITLHALRADSEFVRQAGRRRRVVQIGRAMLDGLLAQRRDSSKNDPIGAPSDVLALVPSSTRSFRLNKLWYSPYCDSFRPLLADQGLTLRTWEVAGDGVYRIPRFEASAFIQNAMFLRILRSRMRTHARRSAERLDGWRGWLDICDRAFGPGYSYSIGALRIRAAQVQSLRKLFAAGLARAKPRAAMVVGYYSAEGMAFVLACGDVGIPTIEIQHGVQGRGHFAYANWARVPVGGFELLPSVFWSWDEKTRTAIAEWADSTFGAHRAICGGNPCLNLPVDAQRAVTRRRSRGVEVLFTAQAFLELPPTILDAIRLSPTDWRWRIRIHPQYSETRYSIAARLAALGLTRCTVDLPGESAMAATLLASDVHVTEFSSSVLEAEALGVPSVIVHDRARVLFADQLRSGVAMFASSGEEVVAAIAIQARRADALRAESDDPAARFVAGCSWLGQLVRSGAR